MGCCHTWQVPPTQTSLSNQDLPMCLNPYLLRMRSVSLTDVLSHDYPELTETSNVSSVEVEALVVQEVLQRGVFGDINAREIEAYALKLMEQGNWKTGLSLEGVTIDVCSSSQYSDLSVVIRAQTTFQSDTSASYLLSLIETPDLRIKWDHFLTHMSVIYFAEGNYYLKNTVFARSGLMINKELVEKCQVREVGAELRMVSYSVVQRVGGRQDFPMKLDTCRVQTVFRFLQLQPTSSGVCLSLVYQSISPQSDVEEIQSCYDWLSLLRLAAAFSLVK